MDRSNILLMASVSIASGAFLPLPSWLQERKQVPGLRIDQTAPDPMYPGVNALAKTMVVVGGGRAVLSRCAESIDTAHRRGGSRLASVQGQSTPSAFAAVLSFRTRRWSWPGSGWKSWCS